MIAALALFAGLGSCRATAPVGPPARPAALWLAGDVFLAYPAADRLATLGASLRGAGVVNLEGPVGPGDAPQVALGPPVVLVHAPTALDALGGAGVRAVGIANNHRADAGADGPALTREATTARGLLAVDERGAVLVAGDGSPRVALTAHLVDGAVPPGLERDLRAAASRADVLVATFHTGDAPGSAVRQAVDAAIAAGARAVAVHGSHEVGRVERRGGAVVAWGLGNLAFDCACTSSADGIALELELYADGPALATVVPVRAGLQGAPAVRATGADADRILDRADAGTLVRGEAEGTL